MRLIAAGWGLEFDNEGAILPSVSLGPASALHMTGAQFLCFACALAANNFSAHAMLQDKVYSITAA